MMENGTKRDGLRPTSDGTVSRRWFLTGLAGVATFIGAAAAERAMSGRASTPGTPVGSPSPAASPVASPAAANQITISNFAFGPATIRIAAGTQISWVNQDDIPHTVTSNDGTSFASPLLDTGDAFHQRFTKPGTYPYHCALHPFMTARVIVR